MDEQTAPSSVSRAAVWRTGRAVASRLPAEPDAVAVRVVARVRIAVALVVAGAGSFVTGLSRSEEILFLLLGLLWVPAATIVLYAADRDGNKVAAYGGPIADIAALSVLHGLLPEASAATLLGKVAVIAFATYTCGRRCGAVLATAAMAVMLVVRDHGAAEHRLETSTVALFVVVLAALVFLLDRTATVQMRTAARSARLQGKSDAILDRVADAVVVTDARGVVLEWSRSAERILGATADDAVGVACHEVMALCTGERRLDCSNGCPLLALAQDDVLGQEAWRADAFGHRQPLLVNVAAVNGPDGKPLEVVHSLRDVTRLKQAEEAKTMFLATASHELKTPLTVIAGFSATLLATPDLDGDSRHDALVAVHRRAVELGRIVDRLLLSSRIEAGRVEVRIERSDITALLHERVDAVRSATGRPVVVSIPDEVPPAAVDERAVITVIDHLLDNAMKYSPGGEPITVVAGSDDESVWFSVGDAGIGMDSEQAGRCFDKFWQAEASDVRRFGGTGIGLYIVRSLVEAMGGHIEVTSEAGVGSTFTVRLRRPTTRKPVVPPSDEGRDIGERTSIREFMRQIGVPREISSP